MKSNVDKPDSHTEHALESKTETTIESRTESKTEYKTEYRPESTTDTRIVSTIASKIESRTDYRPEAEPVVKTDHDRTEAVSSQPALASPALPLARGDVKAPGSSKPSATDPPRFANKSGTPPAAEADTQAPDKPDAQSAAKVDARPLDKSDAEPAPKAGIQPASKDDPRPPTAAKPTDTKPADAKAADTKPADAKPGDAKAADTGKSGPDGKSARGGKDDLKSIPMPDLFSKLGATKDGLTSDEAAKRLKQYGPNEIAEKSANPFLKFMSYFWGPIPWMIEAAVILSGIVRHWLDFGVILLLLCTNAVVGFWEEHQAGNAIAALKSQLAVNARVRRDGK